MSGAVPTPPAAPVAARPAAPAKGAESGGRSHLVLARRRPLQVTAYAALALAGFLGIARCDDDARIPAAAALVTALALLFPVLRDNRALLPASLVVGAIPAALSLRAHAFPAYDVAFAGVLLVLAGECATRSWHVHSHAPRQRDSRWPVSVAVLLAVGAVASAAVVVAARARIDGAVVLTFVGAGAVVVAGLLAARAADE